ncbi:MAG: Gfo/Idh/MocA family oxidoreductase [Chthoniobacterales bacterium]
MKQSSSSFLRVGLIGCGNISNAYFQGLRPFAKWARITACADLDAGKARAKAEEHQISAVRSPDDLLASPEIDIVLNLTIPQSHVAVNLMALRAGKHVYCEKPFSLTTREGVKVLAEAAKRKLRVGCAPDTVLGGGIQTCRQLLGKGLIGRPVAAMANMLCHGYENWHPSPAFYYDKGGGPLFDMGPYYLTALISALGPIKTVSASAVTAFKERVISSDPLRGKKITVKTPTHLTGVVDFASGAVGTITMSFDVWAHHVPRLEIYGTQGSLSCPDPNTFDGPVGLWTTADREWKDIPLTHSPETERGFGLAEMAYGILKKKPHRATGELGLHVVEVMEAFHESANKGRRISLKTTCCQPAPLKHGLPPGRIE